MSDRLPRDREKALEAIATGRYTGRAATGAHPLCICTKPYPEPGEGPPLDTITKACGPEPDPVILAEWQAWWKALREYRNRGGRYWPKDCPVHN